LQCNAIHKKPVALGFAYANDGNAFDDVAHAKAAMSKEKGRWSPGRSAA
jgi:hypothetical protein